MPEPVQGQTVYYVLDDGGAVARLNEGWERQVWVANEGKWVPIDIDFWVEGREITAEEAKAAGAAVEGDGDFGEFAPVDQDDQEGKDGSE